MSPRAVRADALAPKDDLADVVRLFDRWLGREVAEGRYSLRTQQWKKDAADLFLVFVERTNPSAITRSTVEDFFAERIAGKPPEKLGGENTRWRALRQFYRWASDPNRAYAADLMDGMKPPKAQPKERRILTVEEVGRLIGTCQGSLFQTKRDRAILTILCGVGPRVAELAGVRYPEDVDEERGILYVAAKRGAGHDAVRPIPLIELGDVPTLRGMRETFDAYLMLRRRYLNFPRPKPLTSEWLWVSSHGTKDDGARFTKDGIQQMVKRRAKKAGLGHVSVHDLRATAAAILSAHGVSESTILTTQGWTSTVMLRRYTRAVAHDLARQELEGRNYRGRLTR